MLILINNYLSDHRHVHPDCPLFSRFQIPSTTQLFKVGFPTQTDVCHCEAQSYSCLSFIPRPLPVFSVLHVENQGSLVCDVTVEHQR